MGWKKGFIKTFLVYIYPATWTTYDELHRSILCQVCKLRRYDYFKSAIMCNAREAEFIIILMEVYNSIA